MIEERGRVVAREVGAVWVETVRASSCQSCSARQGCGHALVNASEAGARARVRALSSSGLEVGDTVIIGIPEGLLVRGALRVYLLPLVLLLAGALLGDLLLAGLPLEGAAVGGVAGLLAGFVVNRWHSLHHQSDSALHPRVLRQLPVLTTPAEACITDR